MTFLWTALGATTINGFRGSINRLPAASRAALATWWGNPYEAEAAARPGPPGVLPGGGPRDRAPYVDAVARQPW